MQNNKLVSVIIPTYSRAKYITQTIESVLGQTYSPIEIVVVDDNGEGTDAQLQTEKQLQPYLKLERFKYIKHKINSNGNVARNTGAKNSSGQYISFLDDDDQLEPEKIAVQVEELEKLDDSWGGCYCNAVYLPEGDVTRQRFRPTQNKLSGYISHEILLCNGKFCALTPTPLFRREAFLTILFNEKLLRHQDLEMMVRFTDKYKMKAIAVDKPLVRIYLYTQDSVRSSYSKEDKLLKARIDYLDALKNFIEKHEDSRRIYYNQWSFLIISLINLKKYSFALRVYYKYLFKYKRYFIREGVLESYRFGVRFLRSIFN